MRCCLVALMFQGQVVTQGGPPPAPVPKDAPKTLPDTPQGKHVKAYIDAFNTGDEKKFLAVQEELMAAEALARRPAAERAKMFNRMRGDFGTLTVKRAASDAEPDPRRHGEQRRVTTPSSRSSSRRRRLTRSRASPSTSATSSDSRAVDFSGAGGYRCPSCAFDLPASPASSLSVPRCSSSGAATQANARPRLACDVSDNRRFLVTADGRPFFWLGDTAWELFHRLTREDAVRYLDNRARLRFTVIQAVALAEVRRPEPAERVRPSASPQQRPGDA